MCSIAPHPDPGNRQERIRQEIATKVPEGVPGEYQAKRYEGRMRKGGILLSVHADDLEWVSKGKQILEQTGAEDISSTGEIKGDFANTDRPTALVEPAAPVEVVKS